MSGDYAGARQKMAKKGEPRKLLALDGGGIRGLITIEILAKIEALLRQQPGKSNLVLAEYFDYIAGTSTGAVIGTLLSMGKPVDKIRDIYEQFGEDMFVSKSITERLEKLKDVPPLVDHMLEKVEKAEKKGRELAGIGKNYGKRLVGDKEAYSKYPGDPLIKKLKEFIGEDAVTLETDKLKTLLLLVLHNVTTDSPWPVCNNPNAKNHARDAKIPLWQLVRASTAAPLYFPPQEIMVGGEKLLFVDGGVTSYNNPAFQLFLQATLAPYHLDWPASEKKMLLVSVGTGLHPNLQPGVREEDMHALRAGKGAAKALFNTAQYQQDLLCRVFGWCLSGDELDEEVSNLVEAKGGPLPERERRLFTYVRYNATLTDDGLRDLGLPDIKPDDVRSTDSVAHANKLRKIGKKVADLRVKEEHFRNFPA